MQKGLLKIKVKYGCSVKCKSRPSWFLTKPQVCRLWVSLILYTLNISIHSLQIVLYTFPKVLTRKICLTIKGYVRLQAVPPFVFCFTKISDNVKHVFLQAHTAKVIPQWFLDWFTLPKHLLMIFIHKSHPYWNIWQISSLLCSLKFKTV